MHLETKVKKWIDQSLALVHRGPPSWLAYRGDWIKVESIRQSMVADGVVPNEYFVHAQLLAYAVAQPRQPERAEQSFRDALAGSMVGNDRVVDALARAVSHRRCTELMSDLCDGRDVPSQPPRRQGSGGGRPSSIGLSGALISACSWSSP